jgi:hypothetical protein
MPVFYCPLDYKGGNYFLLLQKKYKFAKILNMQTYRAAIRLVKTILLIGVKPVAFRWH